MKRMLALIVVLVAFGSLKAQDVKDPSMVLDSSNVLEDWSEPYTIQIGAVIGLGAAGITIEDPPEGRKVKYALWVLPHYGAALYAPFGTGSKLGGRLDIGVTSTGTTLRPYEIYNRQTNWNGEIIEKHTFFTLAPSISLAGVVIGVGFNFPMMGERFNPDFDGDPHTIDQGLLKPMVMDLRLGGMIAAWKTDLGTLYAEVQARMFLQGIYQDGQFFYGYPARPNGTLLPNPNSSDITNMTPATISVGISYLFNLGL
jgi:hypothetical protein